MLKKLDSQIKKWTQNHPDEDFVTKDLQENPMTGYLQFFRKQHGILYTLYRGLMISFAAMFLVLSLLIYKSLDGTTPGIGLMILIGIDVLMLWGLIRTIREFKKYRTKSARILRKVHEQLKVDFEKLDTVRQKLDKRHDQSRFYSKLRSLGKSGVIIPKQEDYSGWDSRTCPSCGGVLEMSTVRCPNCRQELEEFMNN